MWTVVVTDQNGQVVSRVEWRQGSLTVGREPDRSIVLNSRTASRRHARLDLVAGFAVVVDEGSANGTFVNGARIAAPTRVDASSRIEIGEFRLSLQAASAPQMPAAPRAVPPPSVPPLVPPTFPAAPGPAVSAAGIPPGADITSSFERHLQSVRSYREETQATTINKRTRIDTEWGKLIQNMRALQTRLASDKRVLSFTISRDLREVALKLADPREKRGHRYFLLSRYHPEGKFPGVENVWLREFGRDDLSYDDPEKALEELMLRVAGTLA